MARTYGEMYDEYIDEISGPVEIGSLTYDASYVLKEVDPIAYRTGFNDWSDSECCCQKCGNALDIDEDDEEREFCDDCQDDEEREFCDDCQDDEDDEDDDPQEPEEGDITTEDHQHFYQYGKLVFTVGEDEDMDERIRDYMEAKQFWPSVWFISDHGNAHLMDLG